MTINETVARRMGFPFTRRCARQAMVMGAVVANHWSTNYLQGLQDAEPVVEEDFNVGQYL